MTDLLFMHWTVIPAQTRKMHDICHWQCSTSAHGNDRWKFGVDSNFKFGPIWDTPIAGDWDGGGTDDLGIRRRSRFFLDVKRSAAASNPQA